MAGKYAPGNDLGPGWRGSVGSSLECAQGKRGALGSSEAGGTGWGAGGREVVGGVRWEPGSGGPWLCSVY